MIEDYNPWWVSRDRIGEVEAYRRFEESDVRWIPDVVDRLSLRPFSLNFVFGPRQVGKTTALVLLAKRGSWTGASIPARSSTCPATGWRTTGSSTRSSGTT